MSMNTNIQQTTLAPKLSQLKAKMKLKCIIFIFIYIAGNKLMHEGVKYC